MNLYVCDSAPFITQTNTMYTWRRSPYWKYTVTSLHHEGVLVHLNLQIWSTSQIQFYQLKSFWFNSKNGWCPNLGTKRSPVCVGFSKYCSFPQQSKNWIRWTIFLTIGMNRGMDICLSLICGLRLNGEVSRW